MEPQAHQTLQEVYQKLAKVRDAPSISDKEQGIIIDAVATLRTLIHMYTQPTDQQLEHRGIFDGIREIKDKFSV